MKEIWGSPFSLRLAFRCRDYLLELAAPLRWSWNAPLTRPPIPCEPFPLPFQAPTFQYYIYKVKEMASRWLVVNAPVNSGSQENKRYQTHAILSQSTHIDWFYLRFTYIWNYLFARTQSSSKEVVSYIYQILRKNIQELHPEELQDIMRCVFAELGLSPWYISCMSFPMLQKCDWSDEHRKLKDIEFN